MFQVFRAITLSSLLFCSLIVSAQGEDVENLVKELESFSEEVSAMIEVATPEKVDRLPESKGHWHVETGTETRYERFALSDPKATIPDPTDPESVRRALDELNALIDRAREAGIEDRNLDEAEDLAEEAESILGNPEGDLSEAAGLITVAQILVETAIESAAIGREITLSNYDDKTTSDITKSVFFKTDYMKTSDDGSRLGWSTDLEAGDRFYSAENEFRTVRRLSDKWRLLASNLTEIREYREDFADDVFEDDVDLGLKYEPIDLLEFEVGAGADYRTEYKSDSDDGYLNLSPRAGFSVDCADWGRTGVMYEQVSQRHREEDDDEFDYDADRVRLWWEWFGDRAMVLLEGRVVLKDVNQENDKDDYRENSISAYMSYDVSDPVVVGLRSEVTDRHYDVVGRFDPIKNTYVGDDNTDFQGYLVEPFIEFSISRALSTRFEYRYSRVRNDDRVPDDNIDKSVGDYDANQVAAEIRWSPTGNFEIHVRDEYEVRSYLHGETGKFETWFADLHSIADYGSNTISAWIVYPIGKKTELALSAFNTFEDYNHFKNLDNDQTTVSLRLTYTF